MIHNFEANYAKKKIKIKIIILKKNKTSTYLTTCGLNTKASIKTTNICFTMMMLVTPCLLCWSHDNKVFVCTSQNW